MSRSVDVIQKEQNNWFFMQKLFKLLNAYIGNHNYKSSFPFFNIECDE